jgi:hypothetical protein
MDVKKSILVIIGAILKMSSVLAKLVSKIFSEILEVNGEVTRLNMSLGHWPCGVFEETQ